MYPRRHLFGRTAKQLAVALAAGALAALLVAPAGFAQSAAKCNIFWTGDGSDSKWENGQNWNAPADATNPSRVPRAFDTACIAHSDAVEVESSGVVGGIVTTGVVEVKGELTVHGFGGDELAGPGGKLLIMHQGRLILSQSNIGAGFTVHNLGTVEWRSGFVGMGVGARIQNAGVFDAQANHASLIPKPGAFNVAFHNTGMLTRTAGSASARATIFAPVDNDGRVEAEIGTLDLARGDATAEQTGTFGATTSAGELRLSGGTFAAMGATLDGPVTLDGATIGGKGDLFVESELTWRAGELGGIGGRTTIAEGARLTIAAGATKRIGPAHTLRNEGRIEWRKDFVYMKDLARIENAGTFDALADPGSIIAAGPDDRPQFVNTGLLTRTGGSADRRASFLVPVTNEGTVDSRVGTLAFRLLTQTASGVVRVELRPAVASAADLGLIDADRAVLDGTLDIVRAPGYAPDPGDRIRVLKHGIGTGVFHTVNGVTGFRVLYPADGVWLEATDDTRPAIIFIHGFLGSRIACGEDELWPRMSLVPLRFPRLLDLRLADDGVTNLPGECSGRARVTGLVRTVVGKPVYAPTADFLSQVAGDRAHVFAWDWRKSPEAALDELDAFIDTARQAAANDEVVLISHSMGGLLTRWYIDDPSRAAKVSRAVTVGTSYWGSPKALFPLAAGVEAPGFSTLDWFLRNRELQRLARNLQGLYFLWPSGAYGNWLSVYGRQPTPLDVAGVLSFTSDVLGGNGAQLSHALQRHAAHLDTFKTNGVDYHVVVGTGVPTVGKVHIHPIADGDAFYFVTWVDGDGTVPRRSADLGGGLPAANVHHVCGIEHVPLPGHPTVLQGLKDFLLEGKPITGLDTDCAIKASDVQHFSLALGAGGAASVRVKPVGHQAMGLKDAERRGVVDVLQLGRQTIVTARRRGAVARMTVAGRVVRPVRADRKPPATTATVRRRGRWATVRLRAEDPSGVVGSVLMDGRRTRRVGRTFRVRSSRLGAVRVWSIDAVGNVEPPSRLRDA